MGILKIYLGCMYSGKTSLLISIYRKQISIGRKVLCINYKEDNRFGEDDFVYNHNFDKVGCVKVSSLNEISDESLKDIDCVLINEGQFIDDLKVNIKRWMDNFNFDIIVSGLDGDFKRERFGEILDIIPLCDNVKKLYSLCSICKDGTKAIFSHRKCEVTNQKLIGSDIYIPVCREHYKLLNQ